MSPAILKMLSFAHGGVAPTMTGLVVIFLGDAKGLAKSFAVILGSSSFT
jgi:hypothetical protein